MTNQKTVVIVAPSFPPSGLPPVHRARQFTRWLPENANPFTKLWLAHLSALLLEPFAVKRAAHVTSVSEGTNTGILKRYKNLKESDFTAIPIGGEPEVFQYLQSRDSASESNHADG